MGYNASMASTRGNRFLDFDGDSGIIFSADGSKIYTIESYYLDSSSTYQDNSMRVLAISSTTGFPIWSWDPPSSYGFSSYGSFSQLSQDGLILFVHAIPDESPGISFVAAIDAASGAKIWYSEFPFGYNDHDNIISWQHAAFNLSLPLQNTVGDYFVQTSSTTVVCLSVATGQTRYTITTNIMNFDWYGSKFGFDPSLTYLISLSSNSTASYFSATDTRTPTGVTIWTTASPAGNLISNYQAVEISSTSLFAVMANTASNSASLWSLSLTSGQQLPGFPVTLATSAYINTQFLALVPAGDALLMSRYNGYDADSFSFALVDAVTGEERWVWTQPGFPFPGTIFSADGTRVFSGGACVNIDTTQGPITTCGANVASLHSVSLLSGVSISTPMPSTILAIYPIMTDLTTGGAVAVYWNVSNSRFANFGGIRGVANDGSIGWELLSGQAPAPALQPLTTLSGFTSGTYYYLSQSQSSDFTSYLTSVIIPTPSSSSSSSSNTAAIVGGVIGGAAFVALVGAAFFFRPSISARRLMSVNDEISESLIATTKVDVVERPTPTNLVFTRTFAAAVP